MTCDPRSVLISISSATVVILAYTARSWLHDWCLYMTSVLIHILAFTGVISANTQSDEWSWVAGFGESVYPMSLHTNCAQCSTTSLIHIHQNMPPNLRRQMAVLAFYYQTGRKYYFWLAYFIETLKYREKMRKCKHREAINEHDSASSRLYNIHVIQNNIVAA